MARERERAGGPGERGEREGWPEGEERETEGGSSPSIHCVYHIKPLPTSTSLGTHWQGKQFLPLCSCSKATLCPGQDFL